MKSQCICLLALLGMGFAPAPLPKAESKKIVGKWQIYFVCPTVPKGSAGIRWKASMTFLDSGHFWATNDYDGSITEGRWSAERGKLTVQIYNEKRQVCMRYTVDLATGNGTATWLEQPPTTADIKFTMTR